MITHVVKVALTYLVQGANEAAFQEGVKDLEHAFERFQGRTECISCCSKNGHSESRCVSNKASIQIESQ